MQQNKFKKFINKNNKILSIVILFAFVITAIAAIDTSKRNGIYSKSVFTLLNENKIASRKIASFLKTNYNDEITIKLISDQISELESNFEQTHNIKGNWKGVELAQLNSSQARLLVLYGHLIGDQSKSQSFKDCNDVVCVLNKCYNDKNKLSGYITYFWYLKTGSMLSLSNIIPGQKSKYPGEYFKRHHRYEDYLFNLNELKRFYKLAKTLPPKFLHNPLLKSIHKIPNELSVTESLKSEYCTRSLSTGQILINNNCVDTTKENFFVNMASQMINFIDKTSGLKNKTTSISTSQKWRNYILWNQEDFFDIESLSYKQKWTTHLTGEFLSKESNQSPTIFLRELVANYRYNPKILKENITEDIQDFIAKEFFHNQSYDDEGLYNTFLNQASNEWFINEFDQWKECTDKFLRLELFAHTKRNVATLIEDPLFNCVENKVTKFIEQVSENFQDNDFEARYFFQDKQVIPYKNKYENNLDKIIKENIIKRKFELQTYGKEVIIAQKLKAQFLSEYDPSSIYIKCFQKEFPSKCYKSNLALVLKKFFYTNLKLSKAYQKVITQEIIDILPFENISKNTNHLAKNYLQSNLLEVKKSARELWAYCQESSNKNATLILPLKFSGNKYFVDAGLVNCINLKLDNNIDQLLDRPIFIGKEKILYLTESERSFLSFYYEQIYLQVINNYLLEDVVNEKNYFKNYFSSKKGDILYQLGYYTPLFLEEALSNDHFQKLCVEKVSSIYPQNYYFHSKTELDNTYGRKICSDFAKQPKIAEKQKEALNEKWNKILSKLEKYFRNEFKASNQKCTQTYIDGLDKRQGLDDVKFHCKEIAFKKSLQYTLEEWKDFEEYSYITNREETISKHFEQIKQTLIK